MNDLAVKCHACPSVALPGKTRCGPCAGKQRERQRLTAVRRSTYNSRRGFGFALSRAMRDGDDLLDVVKEWTPHDTGCWLWPGAMSAAGYGQTAIGRVTVLAHRLVYEEVYGPVPIGGVIHHRCAVRACVRPDHLQLTTATANLAEMLERNALLRRIAELEAYVAELEAVRSSA